MIQGRINIPRVWRSQVVRLSLFFVLCIISVALSRRFPWSIFVGDLFWIGDTRIRLTLPIFSLVPLFSLCDIIVRLYNVRYFIDSSGIETQDGLLALSLLTTKVRFEDIRAIETVQTVIDRILSVGTLEIGTSATAGLEIIMSGIEAPEEVKQMILLERDSRQELEAKSYKKAAAV